MNKIEPQLVERWSGQWVLGAQSVHTKKGTDQEPSLGTQVSLQDCDMTQRRMPWTTEAGSPGNLGGRHVGLLSC